MKGVMVLSSHSFFCRERNHDKEYHIQLLCLEDEASDITYRVDYQFGRRGTKLQSKTKVTTSSKTTAENVLFDMRDERRNKGYSTLDLSFATEAYQMLNNCGLTAAGVDIYMKKGLTSFLLKDYMLQSALSAPKGASAVAGAYSAKKTLDSVFHTEVPDPAEAHKVFIAVRAILQLRRLEDFGIFIGHEKDGVVVEGLPDLTPKSTPKAPETKVAAAGGFRRRQL